MDAFIGLIVPFAGTFAPKNWALCNGQTLSIAQNTALFSILGTTYGGNGTTTFNLPDLRGRTLVSAGQGPGLSNYFLGQIAGVEQVTLTTQQMPMHNHNLNAQAVRATQSSPAGNYLAVSAPATGNVFDAYAPTNVNPANPVVLTPNSIGMNGSSQPVQTLPPYTCINYIICLFGIYPSRN